MSEEYVVEFGSAIGNPLVVSMLKVEIVPIEYCLPEEGVYVVVGEGGYIDDAEAGGFQQPGPEQVGEVEVAEMIDRPLHLQPLLGHFAGRDRHNTCVVDEVVHGIEGDGAGEGGDGGPVGQVKPYELHLAGGVLLLALFYHILCCNPVPGSDDHRASQGTEVLNILSSYSRVASSDDCSFS